MISKLALWSLISAGIIIVAGFAFGDYLYLRGLLWISLILYLIPLILGIVALMVLKRSKLTGKGFAITGIVLSLLLYASNLLSFVF